MSEYLRHYIEWGLSQIVLICRREKEVESGYNLELTWETVVARRGADFVEVVAHERRSFAPGAGGSSIGKESERLITSDEYGKAAKGKQILDTPVALEQLAIEKTAIEEGYARHAELRLKRAPLQDRLDKLTPKCPDCDRKMVLRRSRSGAFWGCSAYPRCDGVVTLTAEAKRIISELANL